MNTILNKIFNFSVSNEKTNFKKSNSLKIITSINLILNLPYKLFFDEC